MFSRGYGSCKKIFAHFESQNAINPKFIVSVAKTLADYFLLSLDSLDTIIFHYFWKADCTVLFSTSRTVHMVGVVGCGVN